MTNNDMTMSKDSFREKNLPVVHIQHIAARAGATFLLPNTEGMNFHDKVLSAEEIIGMLRNA